MAYGDFEHYVNPDDYIHHGGPAVINITSRSNIPETCKHAKRHNAKCTFFYSNSGEWLYVVECTCFKNCPHREGCPGMTTAQKSPAEAVKNWNGLMRAM